MKGLLLVGLPFLAGGAVTWLLLAGSYAARLRELTHRDRVQSELVDNLTETAIDHAQLDPGSPFPTIVLDEIRKARKELTS